MPSFRFDLRLFGGDVTSLPFLEDWLQNVLCSFLEHYTLPNKVGALVKVTKCQLANVLNFMPNVLQIKNAQQGAEWRGRC